MVQRGEISRPYHDILSLNSATCLSSQQQHGLVPGRYTRYQPPGVLVVVDAGAPLHWPLGISGGLPVRGSLYGVISSGERVKPSKGADRGLLPGEGCVPPYSYMLVHAPSTLGQYIHERAWTYCNTVSTRNDERAAAAQP